MRNNNSKCKIICLSTPRLLLRTPTQEDADSLTEFEVRNAHHFAPWQSTFAEDQSNIVSKITEWKKEEKQGQSDINIILVSK